jgi:hypothetical protein
VAVEPESSGSELRSGECSNRGNQIVDDLTDLLFKIRVVEAAIRVETIRRMADGDLALHDSCANRAQHVSELGLRPDSSEVAGAGSDDGREVRGRRPAPSRAAN